MDGIGVGALLVLMGVMFLVFLGFYILASVPLYLFLKKSNIRNPWLAFIPLANSYKQNHYLYDLLYSKKLINKEITPEDYVSKRRTFSFIVLIAIIVVSFVSGFVTGMLAEPTTLEYTSNGADLYASQPLTMLDIVPLGLSLVYGVLIYLGMFMMIVNKQTGKRKGVGESVLYTILSIITFGFSWIIQILYYSISDKHDYYLNQYLIVEPTPNTQIGSKEPELNGKGRNVHTPEIRQTESVDEELVKEDVKEDNSEVKEDNSEVKEDNSEVKEDDVK